MTKKELQIASNADLIDWLCYACWREYNSACHKGQSQGEKVMKKICMLKDEIEKRMNNKP